jgi:glucokinase
MARLVADVGGTTTRIAVADDTECLGQLARYDNRDHASFDDVLSDYQTARTLPPLSSCCIAIAGPVTSRRSRLTNRDWTFDADRIAAALPGVSPGAVLLVNDLAALGLALTGLSLEQVATIKGGADPANDQALVVGLGTGFNVCAVRTSGKAPVVMQSELGHASLPSSVSIALASAAGDAANRFATVESLFSGRGISQLHAALSGGEDLAGTNIIARYDPALGDLTKATVDLFARLLGLFAQQLVLQYLPLAGMYFAGGVARGILGSPAQAQFLAAFGAKAPFADLIARVPVRVITDDAAALIGAARFAART